MIKGFLKKEIIQMLRDPVMVFALLIMPIVQVFLFSYTITNEPKNIAIAVVAPANDYLMPRIFEHALASKWFIRVAEKPNLDPFKLISSGAADVVLVAPREGLTAQLLKGQSAELQVLINATNVLKAQAISGYIRGIVAQTLKNELHLAPVIGGITMVSRILFNPEMDTQMFLVPAIMSMVVAMSILSLICVAITKEKEAGTMEMLISAPTKKWQIILGKTLPFILVALFNLLSIMFLSFWFFKVPFRGSALMLAVSFTVFSAAMASLGVMVANYCHNQQQAMLSLMMVLFLQMMLSGSLFPVENMPVILRWLSYINPLSHFTFIVRNIMLKAGDWSYVLQRLLPMIGFGTITGVIGYRGFKQTLD